MIGEPAIAGIEYAGNGGQAGCGKQRPRPPDLAGDKHDRLGAAVNCAVAGSDAHFPEQIPGREIEEGLHARILQRGEAEAALLEAVAEAAGESGAEGAVAIEEDPATSGARSFCISYF